MVWNKTPKLTLQPSVLLDGLRIYVLVENRLVVAKGEGGGGGMESGSLRLADATITYRMDKQPGPTV